MNDIVLVLPTKEHELKANEFKKEFFDCGEKVINCSGLLDQLEYKKWLEHTEKYREEETAVSLVQPVSFPAAGVLGGAVI